jgi:hypothetical protein
VCPGCCANSCVGYICPINWCGQCVCTPCLVCVCADIPGKWSCVDLKGNVTVLVKVRYDARMRAPYPRSSFAVSCQACVGDQRHVVRARMSSSFLFLAARPCPTFTCVPHTSLTHTSPRGTIIWRTHLCHHSSRWMLTEARGVSSWATSAAPSLASQCCVATGCEKSRLRGRRGRGLYCCW